MIILYLRGTHYTVLGGTRINAILYTTLYSANLSVRTKYRLQFSGGAWSTDCETRYWIQGPRRINIIIMSSYIYIPNHTFAEVPESDNTTSEITFTLAYDLDEVNLFNASYSEILEVELDLCNMTDHSPEAIDLDDWGDCTFTVFINGSSTDYDVLSTTASTGDTITIQASMPESYYFPYWCSPAISTTVNSGAGMTSYWYNSGNPKIVTNQRYYGDYGSENAAVYISSIDSEFPTMGYTPSDLQTDFSMLFNYQILLDDINEDLFVNNTQIVYLDCSFADIWTCEDLSEYIIYPLTNLINLDLFWSCSLASSYTKNTNMGDEFTFYIGSYIVTSASNFAYARVSGDTIVYVPSGSTTYTTFTTKGSASTDTVANRRTTVVTY